MNDVAHYVIIGNGVAGNEAAWHLRQRDPDSRITLITIGKLLFINRYQLPRVFAGVEDWREFLVHPPEYYDEHRILVRRNTRVAHVDPVRRVLDLAHKEQVAFDKLLVASGGRGYLPESLREYQHLLHQFSGFRHAMQMRQALPDNGGKVMMLGADMKGLDLARNLIKVGHKVVVVESEQLFWPHELSAEERLRCIAALEGMGLEVIRDRKVVRIEQGASGMPARRLVFEDGGELYGDVVMAFYGLVPTLEFMLGSGVDIERGLLVNPQLRTANEHIWAVGDVCQIWSPEENRYRFYYGWKNVKMMGRIAALNMTGGHEAVETFQENKIYIDDQGEIDSPFWEYD